MEYLGASQYGPHGKVLDFDSSDTIISECGPTELLVKVEYAEINPVDLDKLNAKPFEAVPNPPLIVGYGGSGIVLNVGTDLVNQRKDWVQKRVAFLCDSRKRGSYATHCVVDYRAAAVVPFEISLEHAATVPLAGCTAYEALLKLQIDTASSVLKRLLIVGGAGGVGSWATLLARARYPNLEIVATASSAESHEWCRQMGASHVIPHDDIVSLGGGPNGSVDYILCLTEATPTIMESISQVIHPYGCICLVVAGKSIANLDLSFCFFKSVTVTMQAVFASCRTNYQVVQPGKEIADILQHLADKTIAKAPLSDWLHKGSHHVTSFHWKEAALVEDGLLDQIASGHTRGKLVMKIDSTDNYDYND